MPHAKKPLWACPRCGHRFITRNMWHSCTRLPLAALFRGKPPIIRELFNQLRHMVRRCGPVTIYARKSGIVFQARVRFGHAIPRQRWLDARLWLERRATHPTLVKVESFARYRSHGYGHRFKITSPEQLDRRFAALACEAYLVGRQESRPT